MFPNKRPGKAVWVGIIAAAIAVLFLIILFTVQAGPKEEESIVLPPETLGPEGNMRPQQTPDSSESDHFITVSNDNVASVLQTMERPVAYHQTYSVSVGNEGKQGTRQVELWVNSGLLHAEVTIGQQMRTLITDGTSVYLWYSDTPGHLALTLDETMTFEDILGLPDLDAYLHIPTEQVIDSGYLLPEGTQVQCIYVSVQSGERQISRHWVNLENGLLYQSDVTEEDKSVYSIRQTDFDLLAVEDEIFADRFVLPDGTAPFTVTARTPQP